MTKRTPSSKSKLSRTSNPKPPAGGRKPSAGKRRDKPYPVNGRRPLPPYPLPVFMAPPRQCGTCRFSHFTGTPESDLPDGQCRIEPPTADPENDNRATWPAGLRRTDWCGSHETKDH